MLKNKFGKTFAKAMAGAAGAAAAAAAASAHGQTTEPQQGTNTVTITGGSGATVSVTGINAAPGQTGSVTIIGDQVWIEGVAIPATVPTYTTPAGRTYTIHRDNGRVEVRG